MKDKTPSGRSSPSCRADVAAPRREPTGGPPDVTQVHRSIALHRVAPHHVSSVWGCCVTAVLQGAGLNSEVFFAAACT
ncbi:hypothetical protein EYF80_021003 [Liparis tanakae]|uniref:Uncharacterized protein n=1 Tax=Liparis tanakae TaxID=230148 RepID=A0A4Z2HU15_9TELE|nr:hypothetical protein EYF80_021003 [Liparis tanakae]